MCKLTARTNGLGEAGSVVGGVDQHGVGNRGSGWAATGNFLRAVPDAGGEAMRAEGLRQLAYADGRVIGGRGTRRGGTIWSCGASGSS
jgi:hypothetical protein